MARFTLPRDIYFGPNAISELKNLKGYQKAFIVTGGHSMRKTGFLQKLDDVLKDAGLQTLIYDGVEPDRLSKEYTTAPRLCASLSRM